MSVAQERRRVLSRLLEEGAAQSQAQLLQALEQAGLPSTQPVISRDLRALGAIKAGGRYTLPAEDRITPLQSLRSLLRGVHAAGTNLTVVVCEPGAASAIARALEAEDELAILGTVAGDDTVFVATATAADGRAVRSCVNALL